MGYQNDVGSVLPVLFHLSQDRRALRTAFDLIVHLTAEDVAVDRPVSPSLLRLIIKQLKLTLFRKGWTCTWAEHHLTSVRWPRFVHICKKVALALVYFSDLNMVSRLPGRGL